MSWIASPDAYHLRACFPDVAYSMENVAMVMNLDALRVQGKLAVGRKNARIMIDLTQGFKMIITPTDRGPGGYSEWFTIIRCECRTVHSDYFCDSCQRTGQKETVRAYVQICSDLMDRGELNRSHTIHEDSIESLIISAIRSFNQLSGTNIEPVKVKKFKSRPNRTGST